MARTRVLAEMIEAGRASEVRRRLPLHVARGGGGGGVGARWGAS